jgi:hypothetical protein
MITNFGDFCRFSAKKIGVFIKSQCNDIIVYILAVFSVKNAEFFSKFVANFFPIFRRNVFNHSIGPRSYAATL